MSNETNRRLKQAREVIAELTDRERLQLRGELDEVIAGPTKSERTGGQWDYQRQPFGRGWIQRERKVRLRKDGSRKVYIYWAFHPKRMAAGRAST